MRVQIPPGLLIMKEEDLIIDPSDYLIRCPECAFDFRIAFSVRATCPKCETRFRVKWDEIIRGPDRGMLYCWAGERL